MCLAVCWALPFCFPLKLVLFSPHTLVYTFKAGMHVISICLMGKLRLKDIKWSGRSRTQMQVCLIPKPDTLTTIQCCFGPTPSQLGFGNTGCLLLPSPPWNQVWPESSLPLCSGGQTLFSLLDAVSVLFHNTPGLKPSLSQWFLIEKNPLTPKHFVGLTP